MGDSSTQQLSTTLDGRQDLSHLLRALSVALSELRGGDRVNALRESFTHAREGLRAQKALLLYVRQPPPALDLEILYATGLTHEEQLACSEGRSCDGVSPTVIQQAIKSRETIYLPNPQAVASYQKTASLAGDARSVLCAPVLDPYTRTPVAVLYFQNQRVDLAFEDTDRLWLDAYAQALGQGLGLQLAQQRRIDELEAEARRAARRDRTDAPEILGDSEATRRLRELLHEVFLPATGRDNPRPILILGESGTGKEVVARYLHYYSPTRMKGPFVAFNCAGLRGDTATSVLFGHIRGAFTGAVADQVGLFRDASKGVLFLDEIGDLPLEAQALLLRVIETRSVQPLGQAQTVPVDVQLVLATHRNLAKDVEEGRFRNDLYSRIGGLKILLAPLAAAERAGDIRSLLSAFIARHERDLQKATRGLSSEALAALLQYAWPNNVRELDNVAAALVTHARAGAWIDLNDVRTHCPEVIAGPRHPHQMDVTYKQAKTDWQRDFLRDRLAVYGGDLILAAKSLGLSRNQFWHYRSRLGLIRPGEAATDE